MEVRRASIVPCAVLTLVLLVPGLALSLDDGEAVANDSGGTWTIALYVDADCNLEAYWDDPSLPYLMNIPDSDHVNIVAAVDRLSVDGVDWVEVSYGDSEVVDSFDEMNFGDGATFQWFLEEVEERYEFDHLLVIPWNHGSAWRGFCWDDTSDGDHITLDEMHDAIVGAGVYIDILAFDACSCSSIEMSYEAAMTGLVELLVASEELVAGDGFPYDAMFTPLAMGESSTPDEVAFDMVDGWISSYEPLPWSWYCTLGVVDVMEIAEGIGVIEAWVEQMADGLPAYIPSYRKALTDSYYVSCGSHYQVDMVDLGRHLVDDPVVGKDKPLVEATEAMIALIEGAVKYVYNTDTTAACGGVSIYWGSHNQNWRVLYPTYLEVPFAADTGWGEFLFTYNALTAGWMRITK